MLQDIMSHSEGHTTGSAERATAFQRSVGVRWLPSPAVAGAVAIEAALRPDLCGPAGSLEGGVLCTLVDVAGASAAALGLESPMVATEQLSVSFLAPGRVGPMRATAVPLRLGRDSAVSEVKVVDVGRGDRLVASALVSLRALSGRR
jgi:uncharacterized protein (TIGR00369 family)